ncbi:ATP-dependent helicase [Skermania piniformis]|nr:ATP-dependent DNA helicase [Skermania piniformis]
MTAPAVGPTPTDIAAALGLPPPTPEQQMVISAPPGPILVVAGAGSGKTETMAARVVWLVANRLVAPDQVLGLTFTRKAAQQLTARIRTRLARLAGSDLVRRIDPAGELAAALADSEPEVGTYHAYAGRLLTEYGLLLPVEPTVSVLTETQLWQLTHEVVRDWDGDLDTDKVPATITEAVLALAGQLAEHLVEPDQLRGAHAELEQLIETLPSGPGRRAGPTQKLTDCLEVQRARVDLLPLVARLGEVLDARGALDFGAQMSFAARLAVEHPEVGVAERQRFRAVLLDEYQDTGHAQRVLLSALFGGGQDQFRNPRPGWYNLSVTAVGDPMQSIYGWRGASAANLPRFAADFPSAGGRPAPIRPLMTSWRNPPEALALANAVVEPLRERGVRVPPLRPRPGAPAGEVAIALTRTVADERDWVADRIAEQYARAAQAGDPPPTAAVLVRRNADSVPIAEALRARGLSVEIVGLGGLLATPEVADVVATLRMLAEPHTGGAALRILTGARWQIGITDLSRLSVRARELSIARPGTSSVISDPATLARALEGVLPGEQADRAGLADALADPGPPQGYSVDGYARIEALSRELAGLRERLGQPLTELVADVERTIGVGVEARARRRAGMPGAGREHLDAFADVVAGFAADPGATLGGLLAFLTAAESVENGLEPGEVAVAPDRVQVLTVHAAKGLEWAVVAVPHVVTGVFPVTRVTTWLTVLNELPPALRGDRAQPAGESADELSADQDGVPVLDVADVTDRAQLEAALDRHKEALRRRQLAEERRLFYVALTRTERALFVSGHHWAQTGTKPKGPSELLIELRDTVDPGAVAEWADPPDDDAANPFAEAPVSAVWPPDPLGPRRAFVELGAATVRAALATDDAADDPDPGRTDPEGWVADVDLLLAEQELRREITPDIELPGQLAATQLVELSLDPARLASRLRRPVPFPPDPLARRGTAFHAWVERRFGATRLLDLDDLGGSGDVPADAELTRLQAAFERSVWARRSPIETEVQFETTIAGTLVRGRIDAVFAEPDGGWTVVDWKTGAEPMAGTEAGVAVQLGVYRVAWARLIAARTGLGEDAVIDRVGAAFHYVRSGRTVSPAPLPGPAELAELIATAEFRARNDGGLS